jgi:DNA-binding CsgD family transcriptional regulator
MVVHAALGLLSEPLQARLCPIEGLPLRSLLSIRRPNTGLPGLLSHAERAIVDMLIEGRGRVEMSLLRGCSVRTIANQIAQVYKKLAISGRVPLIIRLLRRDLRERFNQ